MKKLNINTVALAVGSFVGLVHLVWALLVYYGVGEFLLRWILELHFLSFPVTVSAFEPMTALALLITTSAVGYVWGAVFAFTWNVFARK